VENFHLLRDRQTADAVDSPAAPGDKSARVNLLNWDGNGRPQGLFPRSPGDDESEPRP
jgi:nitrate reductase beta subunit